MSDGALADPLTVEFSEAESEPIVADTTYAGVVDYPVVSRVDFREEEVEPIVAYDAVVRYPVVSRVDFGEEEVEPIVAPAPREIAFSESEAEPIVAYDSVVRYPVVSRVDFGEEEVEPVVAPAPREIEFSESEVEPIVAGAQYDAAVRSPAIAADAYAPAISYPVKAGDPRPPRLEETLGLTEAHRALRARPRVAVDPVDPWGTAEAARAFKERKLSREGMSSFLADYKDRWVRAHRRLITQAAAEYDVPDWLLAGVAWTEVGGDPPWFDEGGVKVRQYLAGDPNATSFGPVQIQLRRVAEELGYNPRKLSAIQRRVLIWAMNDAQQNVYVVAAHLRRIKDIDAPRSRADQLTDDQVRLIGARYNRGLELQESVLRDTRTKLSYGDNLIIKRDRVTRLLRDP